MHVSAHELPAARLHVENRARDSSPRSVVAAAVGEVEEEDIVVLHVVDAHDFAHRVVARHAAGQEIELRVAIDVGDRIGEFRDVGIVVSGVVAHVDIAQDRLHLLRDRLATDVDRLIEEAAHVNGASLP